MKLQKLYVFSLLVNLVPITIARLILGDTIGDENMIYVIYILFFMAAALLNLSFFKMKSENIQKSRMKLFFSKYLSSIFFLIIALFDILNHCCPNKKEQVYRN